MLFGIHSIKYEKFLFLILSVYYATKLFFILPLKIACAVKYLPCLGSIDHNDDYIIYFQIIY